MTALTPPADDAPAEEWGALAERIPGFRLPPVASHFLHLAGVELGRVDCDVGVNVIDPDHWAWEGWLLRLLGQRCLVRILPREGRGRYEVVIPSGLRPDGRPHRVTGRILGRAAITAAAAIGRWPGGAS